MNQALLVLETLRLPGTADPERLREAWATASTVGLRDLIAFEGCAVWLHRRLVQIHANGRCDGGFAGWLEREARAVTARNLLVDAEAEALLGLLEECETPCVLIKGTARRAAASAFPYADARATHDVDVLLPADRAEAVWSRLRGAGYVYATRPELTPNGHYHLVPLRGERRVAVELHTSTSRWVAPSEAWRRATSGARAVEWCGRRVRVPSDTELLWQAIAHALVQPEHGFRLRYFQDAAVVLSAGGDVQWDVIEARVAGGEAGEASVAVRWIDAAAEFAGRGSAAPTRPPRAFALGRALIWRLAVHRRTRRMPRLAARLLEEGTRAEAGLPLTPGVPGTSWSARMGRRTSAVGARGAYLAWRAVAGS